jgi:hypothetical protein
MLQEKSNIGSAEALSMKERSAKYQAARAAGIDKDRCQGCGCPGSGRNR